MSLRNLTSRNVIVKAKLIVAQVATANVVLPMLIPNNSHTKSPDMNSEAKLKVKLTKEQLKNCSKIDLSGKKIGVKNIKKKCEN